MAEKMNCMIKISARKSPVRNGFISGNVKKMKDMGSYAIISNIREQSLFYNLIKGIIYKTKSIMEGSVILDAMGNL